MAIDAAADRGPDAVTSDAAAGGSADASGDASYTSDSPLEQTPAYRVGATLHKDEIDNWEPKLPINMWMRVFPNSDGLPPAWTDPRFSYLERAGAIPFVSTKIDGDSDKLASLRQRLIDMPKWITTMYISDRHEPEGDLSPETYKSNFVAFADTIRGLPSEVRAKVRFGHVLTRQWTENTAVRTYATHDTGLGDFFGVDMYMNSWGAGGSVATSFPDAAT